MFEFAAVFVMILWFVNFKRYLFPERGKRRKKRGKQTEVRD